MQTFFLVLVLVSSVAHPYGKGRPFFRVPEIRVDPAPEQHFRCGEVLPCQGAAQRGFALEVGHVFILADALGISPGTQQGIQGCHVIVP